MTPDLNRAYQCLFILNSRFPDSVADTVDLAREAKEANLELAGDIDLFQRALDQVERLLNQGDTYEQENALVLLRSWTMNIKTAFDNLVNSIEEVAFSKQVSENRRMDEGG